MIEMLLLGLYTVPLGIWLGVTIIPAGLNREPVAFSVNEMLALIVAVSLIVCCFYLIRRYRTTQNEGNGYWIAYGLLIFIGSLSTSILLISQLLSMGFVMNLVLYILGAIVFVITPFFGLAKVWRRLRRIRVFRGRAT